RVLLNLSIGNFEILLGLGVIILMLFALCIINLFTKQVAILFGVGFTIAFFVVFMIFERVTKGHGGAHAELDQFNLEQESELTLQAVGARLGNILVLVSNIHALYHLGNVLDCVKLGRWDVVVLHVRLLRRSASKE